MNTTFVCGECGSEKGKRQFSGGDGTRDSRCAACRGKNPTGGLRVSWLNEGLLKALGAQIEQVPGNRNEGDYDNGTGPARPAC
jgi:hypothetical protein